jgi:pimeloyl-ACP methyl ester carboxylesterase
MVHGFGVSGHMFDEFAERMQDHFHLIAVDQRGHGDSDWAEDGDYTRGAFVEDLEAFRAAVGIDRCILIGHSMGGLNAVSYTVAYPERVRALVLVDVGPEAAKEGVDNIVRFTRGPDELEFEEFVEMAHRFNPRRSLENIRERMRHRLKPTETGKYTWKFDRRFRQPESGLRIGSELSNDESWQLFRQVSVPTLLIRGAESDVLSQDVAERAAREMQRTRLMVVAGAGHSVPGDNPDDFTAAVREFLGDLQRGLFEPVAASEPPPLQQLIEEHEAARRRGVSLPMLVFAGVAGVVALAGAGYVWRRSAQNRRQRTVRGRAQATAQSLPGITFPPVDLEAARRRAASLVDDLSGVGRQGVSRARQTVQDVDLERVRHAAAELAQALSDGSRIAPAAVKAAAARVDRKKLQKRTSRGARVGRAVARAALAMALTTGSKALGRKKTRRGRMLAWRG